MSLERLIEGLAETDASFVVVGMVAGQLYGSRVATYDLDVVYEPSEDNTRKIFDYLASVDAYVKETWPNEGVSSEFSEAVLRTERSLTLGTSEGEIDVLERIDGFEDYESVRSMSEPILMPSGKTVYFLSLRGLIAAKRASDREKDRMHLLELEAIAELQNDR